MTGRELARKDKILNCELYKLMLEPVLHFSALAEKV